MEKVKERKELGNRIFVSLTDREVSKLMALGAVYKTRSIQDTIREMIDTRFAHDCAIITQSPGEAPIVTHPII